MKDRSKGQRHRLGKSKHLIGFPGGAIGKDPSKRGGMDPWVGRISWRRAWQPTPVSLLAESHAQRSQTGYTPWGLKESDMTEAT